jgi:hypothetical protein
MFMFGIRMDRIPDVDFFSCSFVGWLAWDLVVVDERKLFQRLGEGREKGKGRAIYNR